MKTNLLGRARRSITKKGLRGSFQTLLSVIDDFRFDLAFGTDTSGWIDVENLDIAQEAMEHSAAYAPSRARHVRKLLEALRLPPGRVLVDLGCGKGKVLLLAADYEFKRIVGVEISARLCQIARNNLMLYEHKVRRPLHVEIIQSDASQYAVREDEDVFFLYNPFDYSIMEVVLGNIVRSLAARPRRIWLIMSASKYGELPPTNFPFQQSMDLVYGGHRFVVYVTK